MSQKRVSTRGSLAVVLLAVAVAGFACAAKPAVAQSTDTSDQDKAQRASMYARLEREAAAVERVVGVLKLVIKLAKPTVVHIEAHKVTEEDFVRRRVEEAGSGVIIQKNKKFYVLTNRHVIKDTELSQIIISLADGRRLKPSRVWSDPGTDVAVMAVTGKGLVAARIADSRRVEIGDFVLAMGSPFGLSHSVSFGIISAKGRRDLELGTDGVRFQNFFQTDAAINPGNSGGPLFNLRGEMIGINTAIASNSGGNEGIGFTIPSKMVMLVADQLIAKGRVERAYLGVTLDGKFGPEAATRLGLPRLVGARISTVRPGSPAAAAKLLADDVILKFGDTRVEDDNHLINLVGLTPVGKEVPVVVFRNRKSRTVQVKVADLGKASP